MSKREIIKIDEDKCDGCGSCIPNCPEGALQIIDNKARLVSDLMCDGLGACIGECPQGAITTEEREAQDYDEKKVMENIVQKGENVIKAHLLHLRDHGQHDYLQEAIDFLCEKGIANPLPDTKEDDHPAECGCPGAKMMDFKKDKDEKPQEPGAREKSALRQWPVQITLVPPNAPYFQGADLVVTADCVPVAYANFHADFLTGKSVLMGCPKLDDLSSYQEKMTEIFTANDIKSITVLTMEVPCCTGLQHAVETAIKASGKKISLSSKVISIRGEEN